MDPKALEAAARAIVADELALKAAREAYAQRSEEDDAPASAAQYRAGDRDDTGEIKMAARAVRIALSEAAEAIVRLTRERDEAREALRLILHCTPHIHGGSEIRYDCGNPFDIAREALPESES